MFPIGDENPTLRTPVVTIALLVAIASVWVVVQGAGFDDRVMVASVCNLGLVPGEITKTVPLGTSVPLTETMSCVVDDDPINWLTPVSSMFLHGGWGHLLGNALFLWVFGNNVEDSMGRIRFVLFYLICGLGAAFAQVAVNTSSAVPMVGASGAISGVLGGYLILYPRVRVKVLFIFVIFIQIISVPAFLVLLLWIGYQVLLGLPQLTATGDAASAGVAFWAHIGGFASGAILVRLFSKKALLEEHRQLRRRHGYG